MTEEADDQNEDYQSANDRCRSDACEPGDERVKDVVNVGHLRHTFTAAKKSCHLAAEIDVPLASSRSRRPRMPSACTPLGAAPSA